MRVRVHVRVSECVRGVKGVLGATEALLGELGRRCCDCVTGWVGWVGAQGHSKHSLKGHLRPATGGAVLCLPIAAAAGLQRGTGTHRRDKDPHHPEPLNALEHPHQREAKGTGGEVPEYAAGGAAAAGGRSGRRAGALGAAGGAAAVAGLPRPAKHGALRAAAPLAAPALRRRPLLAPP